jgi:WD40 repeat protein
VLKWNIETKTSQVIFAEEDVQRVVSVSPNERYLAIGTDNSDILLYDLKAVAARPRQLTGHIGGTVYDLVFLPNNQGFISVGEDNRILKNDFTNSTEIMKVEASVNALALSPDGKTLACGASNGEVYIVDLSSSDYRTTRIWPGENAKRVEAITFDKVGRRLAFGDYSGNVIIWDLEAGDQYGPTLTGFTSPITDVEYGPNSRLLAASSRDKSVRFWDLENVYDLPTVLDDHDGWVWDISFNSDGEHIATASADGYVRSFPLKPEEMALQINQYITTKYV